MTLEQLGSLGEIVSGIGIIISLIYVGVQVRQSNKLAIAASEREVLQASYNINHFMAEHVSVVRRGVVDFEALTPDEQTTFSLVLSSDLNYLDLMIKMRAKDLATDYDVATWGDFCTGLVTSPGGKIWWGIAGHTLQENSRDYINGRIARGDVPPAATETYSFLRLDDERS